MKTVAIHLGLRRGFSLVEILTATAVLSILAMTIVQLTSVTNRSIRLSNRPVDATAQARLVLDRLGLDLSSMVRRTDVDCLAVNPASGTGTMLEFFSMVSSTGLSTSNNRKVSLVAYQIASHPDNNNMPCLVRAGLPVSWSQTSFFGLKGNGLPVRFNDTMQFPQGLLPQSISDYDVLAPGVIRMVVGFKLVPDNQSVTLSDSTTLTAARGQIVYSPPIRVWIPTDGGSSVSYLDWTRVSSLVVGIVVVDLESLKLLKTSSQFTALAGSFPTPTGTSSLPLQTWSAVAANVNSISSTLPLPVRQSVRVFQRVYPVSPMGGGQP